MKRFVQAASGHQETISSAPGKVGNRIRKQPFESRAGELATLADVADALLHSSTKTTQLDDHRHDRVSIDEIERIVI
ncbi:MAG: hypothetical protein OEU92_28510 [Alphaproteobacteria bacterium]|nr:hypothetical protein [Alphaproteobacteria bacterium]